MANAAPARAPESPWNLTLRSTDEIVNTLAERGLPLDRDLFRRQARQAGSPSALAGEWLRARPESPSPEAAAESPAGEVGGRPGPAAPAVPPGDPEASLLTATAWELWKRWGPDLHSPEILAEEFDRHYEPLDNLLMGDPRLAREALARADRIVKACARPGEPPDGELFQEIWGHCWHDLAVWLRCLPLILARRDMLEEAIRLCARLAPLFEARAFLADRAILLAQAGRAAEARAQVMENMRRWRRDPVVLRKACETLWSLGNADEALLLYDEVLSTLARSPSPGDRP